MIAKLKVEKWDYLKWAVHAHQKSENIKYYEKWGEIETHTLPMAIWIGIPCESNLTITSIIKDLCTLRCMP